MRLTVGSLFAGVGGFDLAAERAGMEVVWQSEIDAHASRVLDHHWPHIKNYGDIHDLEDPPTVDVLTGGFPCQDYSVAGLRGGLAGDRGALWWEFHRVIAGLRPAWIVGENVPGLLSSRDGADFATIVDSLVGLGYGVVWRVLDAQWFGVAQRRRRVFIVGHSGGEPRPEVLALGQSVSGDTPPRRETRENLAPTLGARTRGGGGLGTDTELDGGLVAFNWQSGGDNRLAPDTEKVSALHAGQTPAVAFAQNQRDEVRELGDVAVGLQANPGMKQQTYVMNLRGREGGAMPEIDDIANLRAATGGSSRSYVAQPLRSNPHNNSDPLMEASMHIVGEGVVRRLTPLECERLQGFPDNWTRIPGNSDTQRYRQMGNAVAVPVAEWIMGRIAQVPV